MTMQSRGVRVPVIRRLAAGAALLVVSLLAVTCGKDSGPPPGATQLSFKVEPASATAATTLAAVVVEARDANGAPVTDFNGSITIAFGTNPGGGSLAGTTTATASGGVAPFNDLSINKSGTGYKLKASSSGLSDANSATFNINPGPAAQISFGAQPTTAIAGGPLAAIKVRIEDAQGNLVDAFGSGVSVAITSGTGTAGAALSGTTTMTPTSGVATFSTLSIDKVGASYTISATASGLPDATSTSFDVTPGPADHLVISGQPGNTTAGANMSVQVTAYDALGNIATGFSGLVSLAITSGTGTAGATLSGIASMSASSGVATFSVLNVDKAGVGYTLAASAAGVPTGATTAPFNIAVGAAALLNFTVQPSTVISGVPITPVQVSVEDGSGNVVTGFGGNIDVALFANPGGGILSGTKSRAPSNGVATFSDLSIDKSGIGYTLTVTATNLTGATSDPFNILAGAGANLVFTGQPTSIMAGAGIPGIEVTLKDAQNNVATGFNGIVTLAIGTNAGGGTLVGATTVAAVSGVATFPGVSIDKVGTNYTLKGSVTGVPDVTSAPFNILPGAASQLVYSQQPHNAVAGGMMTPAVLLTALDAAGNVATGFNGLVTVAITAGTGTSGATLSGAIAVAAVNGVATFGTLNINKSGTGYTLGASGTGLIGATSAGFDITAGTAAQLAFSVQPTNAVAGSSLAPDVQVAALDILGNVATSFNGNITVGITPGTGTAGAALTGTLTQPAPGGVARFSALSLDKAGTGYTLGATATGLNPATSSAFAVAVGSAVKLVFSVQPVNTTAGSVVTPGVELTAEDAGGNMVTSFTGAVTVDIGTNPAGGVLAGTTTVPNAASGVATFSNLSIAKSGTGYTLTASATGLVGATSNTFNIVAGPATQLTFGVQPTAVAAGASINPAVEVAALDLLGNIATSFTGSVTMAIGTNPPTATLSGTLVAPAVAGIASFANLKIDKSGVGFTLSASATGVTPSTSAAFDVTIGVPTKLFISVQPPASDTAGVPLAPAIQVLAQDAAGNTVPTFAGSVSIAIATGTGTTGAILSGTVTVGATAGIATFSNLSIDKAGTGYKLTATSFGLTSVTSTAFAIVPGTLVKLGFTVQPVATKSGTAMSPAVKVAGQDALGNTITTFNANVTVAIGVNAGTPTSGTLTGTLTVKASNGVSSFSTLKIDKVGVGYTLIASSGALLGATSLPFNITPGNATQVVFSAPPLSTAANGTIPPVKVTALDAAANVATGFTGIITVAIGTNAGAIPGTLTGTLTFKAVAGVSTFSTLKIDQAGNGYTLTASAAGLTGATSPAFDITNGSALSFTVQPTAVNANAPIIPAVKVTAKDNLGAVLTTFNGPITVAIAAGTGTTGATLGGSKTVNAASGVATFSDLNIDVAGTGYKLTAASTGFSTGTSNAFTVNGIVAGPATKLGFTTQPSSTPAGATIIPGVVVAVQDVNGNTVTGLTGTITIALASNPAGGTLSGTLTVNINAGKGSFPNLSLDKVGSYTMQATTSLGLTPATSSTFTITTAATLHLVFTTQPVATTAGQPIPLVQVAAQNASNVTVTSFTGPVTVAITAGSGANGAVLNGTTTVNAVNGVAPFASLSITKAGAGFKLSATAAGVAGGTSASFVINPDVAITLHWATQPTTTLANAVINGTTGGVTVDARDQFNNVVKTFVGNITVAISGGTSGAVLSGTKTVMAISGVATFTNLSINLPGSGNFAYRLAATTAGLASANSAAFSVN